MKKIAVIGSINLDFFLEIERLPNKGETILSKSFDIKYGGKGANQAFNASILGSNVTLFSMIGNDKGVEYLDYLSKVGINTEYIKNTFKNTGNAIILLDKNKENSIIVAPESNLLIDIEYIEENRENILKNEIILIQNEINIETTKYILESFSNSIAYNFAPAINLEKEYFKHIKYLIVNEEELQYICKNIFKTDEKEIFSKLLDIGVKNILLTKGKKGSLFVNKDIRYEVEAKKVQTIDTTGAGDSFIGAFLHKLNKEEDNILEALEFATKVASVVVSHIGAQVKEIGEIND